MTNTAASPQIQSAFVTGSTGLLGNNLVRLLVSRGIQVKALARSRKKAEQYLAGLPVEIITGEMTNVAAFAEKLRGVDVLFHTAAYFRDSFKGGKHWKELYDTNVRGTADLLVQAHREGIRRVVHTSSTNVLFGARGQLINDSMRRDMKGAEDYSRSKILADWEIDMFLDRHPDMTICMVLPGWIIGPGDAGPTSAGQLVLDFLNRKLPGVPPATFSVVDARDVAEAMLAAALKGRRAERYIAAGRHISMADLVRTLQQVSGVPAPKRAVPRPFLYALALANEAWARISGQPTLISLAAVKFMGQQRDRTHFDSSKSERELGIHFRPLEETLRDTIAWYQENGWLKDPDQKGISLHPAGQSN